jgi:hypothetical protein
MGTDPLECCLTRTWTWLSGSGVPAGATSAGPLEVASPSVAGVVLDWASYRATLSRYPRQVVVMAIRASGKLKKTSWEALFWPLSEELD